MTKVNKTRIKINEAIGYTSIITMVPTSPKALIILGHGAGAGMEHRFMQGLAESLAAHNLATVRYNFPYMENKKGRPDRPPVAHQTIRSVVTYSDSEYPGLTKILAGKSFGGRMASQTMAEEDLDSVSALVFYGFPLHSPAKPGTERASHLFEVKVPMLFLQGDRDNLARIDLLEPLIERLDLATLKIFEGADHSFRFLKKFNVDEQKALHLLAESTAHFLQEIDAG